MSTFEEDDVQDLDPAALRASLFAMLVAQGIESVSIGFDGSGDEGQIEDIDAVRVDGTPDTLAWPCGIPGKIATPGQVWDPEHRTFVRLDEPRPMKMREFLEEWVYDLLVDADFDWENNDGGFGEIVITPALSRVRCELNTRFMDHETSEHDL